MSDSSLNAERVAAFLDGRLSTEERAIVLAQLAADPDWREVAIDAAAISQDVNEADGNVESPSLNLSTDAGADGSSLTVGRRDSRRSATRTWAPWVALAAAASITVFALVRRDDTVVVETLPAPVAPVQALAMTVASEDVRDLMRERWRVVRAGAGTLDETTRSVRLGALSVDALLDREGQGAEARAEMVDLLQPLNAAVARALVNDARDSASFVVAFGSVRQLVLADAYDVGVWLELLRAGSESARSAPGTIERLLRVVEAKELSPERAAELTARVRRLEEALRAEDMLPVSLVARDVLGILAS